MNHNRIQHQFGLAPLSTETAPAAETNTFLVCPVVLLQGGMGQACPWQGIYQLAYERAQAVVRPSRVELIHRSVSWN